jgi:2-C-methyl-D-erythritol 4-phosphate cytidylyltransferase
MEVVGVVLTSGTEPGLLDNRTLVDHAASALRGSGVIASVVVAAPGHPGLHSALSDVDDAAIVVLHRADRPLAPPELVVRVVEAVRAGAEAAVPVVEVTETVKEVDAAGRIVRTVPREALVQVQTPQAVRAALLLAAHASCGADDPLLPVPGAVVTVPGAADAFPVRDAHDLALAEAVRATRAGAPPA